ncbi:SMI1/KNR4 family protein [Streptomyces venezuelae]|uniref:SMI1/KNR4 family protein n=1 Tax=Streptomyces venezuelae TaxID=54571 RepID=UPI00278C1064|nr:SMI1/KNR4 family protein [Streptomyces venezuelae]
MTTDLVGDSWDRIDAWLREHAPRTFALLAPPATDAEIRATEELLDVRFHPDLVASLRRHDGALSGLGAFQFPTHDRLLGLREMVEAAGFMRGMCEDLSEEESEGYWQHGFLKFGSYEGTSDGLTIDCRHDRDSYGAVGRFFDETGTDFGRADSLGGYLAEVADELEGGGGNVAVTFNGRLIWETELARLPEWAAAVGPVSVAEERALPPLSLPDVPPGPVWVHDLHGLEELGALVATLPRERVATAARRQIRRLASETGLFRYEEVASALDALDRGETVPAPDPSGPLGRRLREVLGRALSSRDRARRMAVEALVQAVWGLPHKAVCETACARSLVSLLWRDELLADLGDPPVPAEPDDLFWASLRNPDVESSWYAEYYRDAVAAVPPGSAP